MSKAMTNQEVVALSQSREALAEKAFQGSEAAQHRSLQYMDQEEGPYFDDPPFLIVTSLEQHAWLIARHLIARGEPSMPIACMNVSEAVDRATYFESYLNGTFALPGERFTAKAVGGTVVVEFQRLLRQR